MNMYIEPKITVQHRLTGGMTVPTEARLFLYISARYLQALETALQLRSVAARYERPGIKGVALPRLVVTHPEHREMDKVICVNGQHLLGPNAEWWFHWWQWRDGSREPICRTGDPGRAARIIACQLHEGSPHGHYGHN